MYKCPQCACQIQKEGGCPQMECSVCHYEWCWTCGLPTNHLFHKLVIGNVLCDYVNTFCFGFEQRFNFHILCKVFITILLLCLLPLILEFITVYVMCYGIYQCCCCKCKKVKILRRTGCNLIKSQTLVVVIKLTCQENLR